MAAITSVAIGAVSAGYSIYNGVKQKKEAKEALANLEQPDLINAFKDVPISTIGSEFLREETGRTTASVVDASRNAGTRGIFGAIPRIQAQNNDLNREGQVYLDNQVNQRNRLIAEDERRIQGFNEGRYNAELAGIGKQMDVAQKYTDQGIRGATNTLLYAANNIDWSKDGDGGGNGGDSKVNGASMGMNPMGMSPYMMNSFSNSDLLAYQKRKGQNDSINEIVSGYGSNM